MYLARTTDGRRIPATRDESGHCPSCNEQLTAKLGDIYEWHWSHKAGQACSYRKTSTSWQYGWIRHYHGTGEWEMETLVDGVDFDGVHPQKRLALMLALKLDLITLNAFIDTAAQRGLKPVVIFNAKAFERFQFEGYRLRHPRRSDNSWVLFFSHAFRGHARTASLWVDIEQDEHPHFGLRSGLYNLAYSGEFHGAITVHPVYRQRPVFIAARPLTDHFEY
ncbi:competence protein CoiA [Pseudomonas silvicola]|nr:competence protein CoiA [Pseudomonas silvicola]